jgi:hypothetical protein
MTRDRLLAVGCALLAGLAVVAGFAHAGVSTARVFSVAGPVTAIAADGPRVAIAVTSSAGCDRIVIWTAPRTVSQAYASKTSCAGAVFHGIAKVAIAGTGSNGSRPWAATSRT